MQVYLKTPGTHARAQTHTHTKMCVRLCACVNYIIYDIIYVYKLAFPNYFFCCLLIERGPLMVVQWLRYCAANRKLSSSNPGGVIGIFH
jgi:hypothetical protein